MSTKTQKQRMLAGELYVADDPELHADNRRIFTGWMFADSPGLNAVEHPVYDVWLKDCKTDSSVPPAQ